MVVWSDSDCYETGDCAEKKWREMSEDGDPLVQFFPDDADCEEATGE